MRALHGRNVWHFCQVIADALDAAMTYGAAPKSSGRPSGQVRRVGEPRRNVAPEDREGQDRTYWNWSGDRALCGRVDDARHRVPPRRRGPAPRFDGLVRDGGVDRAPAGLWCPVRRAGTTGPGGHRAAARRDRSARGSDAVALLGRWPRRPPPGPWRHRARRRRAGVPLMSSSASRAPVPRLFRSAAVLFPGTAVNSGCGVCRLVFVDVR